MTFKKLCFLLMITSKTVTCSIEYLIKEVFKKGSCTFEDIKCLPAGRTVVITKATSPSVKIQKSLIWKNCCTRQKKVSEIAGKTANTIDVFAKVKKTSAKIFKSLLKLVLKFSQALGVFGVVFSFIEDATKPDAQQIIDSTNVAFEQITETLNQKLDQLQGYVDSKVLIC